MQTHVRVSDQGPGLPTRHARPDPDHSPRRMCRPEAKHGPSLRNSGHTHPPGAVPTTRDCLPASLAHSLDLGSHGPPGSSLLPSVLTLHTPTSRRPLLFLPLACSDAAPFRLACSHLTVVLT